MSKERITELLEKISNDENYKFKVFFAPRIYFIIYGGKITEISDDANCTPRGGWFPDIVCGPTEEENKSIETMMEKLGFDESFFLDMIDCYGEFDEDCVEEYFEDNEDEESLEIYRKIRKKIDSGNTPFESVDAFASALGRYGLDSDSLYYEWEGEYLDLYESIAQSGEPRGCYDIMSDDEWVKLLEHIDDHIVTADE